MLTISPLQPTDGGWECPGIFGVLCHHGLNTVLGTKLDPSHQYELRVYGKRPRTDVTELRLASSFMDSDDWEPGGWAQSYVLDENGHSYEIDDDFIDKIHKHFGHLKDEDGIRFYVRVLDLGECSKVVHDVEVDPFSNIIRIYADDSTIAEVDVEELVDGGLVWKFD